MTTKHPKRMKGWIGTRIEVCGRPFGTLEPRNDFLCTLPPGHEGNLHSSVAIDDEKIIYHIVYDHSTEEIQVIEHG